MSHGLTIHKSNMLATLSTHYRLTTPGPGISRLKSYNACWYHRPQFTATRYQICLVFHWKLNISSIASYMNLAYAPLNKRFKKLLETQLTTSMDFEILKSRQESSYLLQKGQTQHKKIPNDKMPNA